MQGTDTQYFVVPSSFVHTAHPCFELCLAEPRETETNNLARALDAWLMARHCEAQHLLTCWCKYAICIPKVLAATSYLVVKNSQPFGDLRWAEIAYARAFPRSFMYRRDKRALIEERAPIQKLPSLYAPNSAGFSRTAFIVYC